MTVEQILTEIRAMLTEIIGAEYALGLDIGMDTSFDNDLDRKSTRLNSSHSDSSRMPSSA